jgi:glycosyltransferase involved in cell wall biosynthesis
MKVGLLVAFAGRNCGSPEIYEREVTRALLEVAPQHDYHLYYLDRRAPEVLDVQGPNVTLHEMRPSSRVISMLTSVPAAIRRTQPDVFHGLVVPPPVCPRGAIMAINCSTLVKRPEFFPPLVRARLRFLLHRAVPRAAKVICPSYHVQEVLVEYFQMPIEKFPVVYAGLSPRFRETDPVERAEILRERYQINYPYFLFSGRWEKRKNLAGIVRAYARYRELGPTEHRLVLTGGKGWDSQEVAQEIVRLRLEPWVVDLGKSPVEELHYLYGGADAIVFASLWEGFGLPILEGMACGTPVITSNNSAMPETAGGAALLVDPLNPDDIAHAMKRLADDEALRSELRVKGLARAKPFTWRRTGMQMAALYEEVRQTEPALAR